MQKFMQQSSERAKFNVATPPKHIFDRSSRAQYFFLPNIRCLESSIGSEVVESRNAFAGVCTVLFQAPRRKSAWEVSIAQTVDTR